jgi:hypothetical protein
MNYDLKKDDPLKTGEVLEIHTVKKKKSFFGGEKTETSVKRFLVVAVNEYCVIFCYHFITFRMPINEDGTIDIEADYIRKYSNEEVNKMPNMRYED